MHLGSASRRCITFLQRECEFEAQQPTRSSNSTPIIIDQPSSSLGNHSGALLEILNIESTSSKEKHPSQRQRFHVSPSRLKSDPTTHQVIQPLHLLRPSLLGPIQQANPLLRGALFVTESKTKELQSEPAYVKFKLNDPEYLSSMHKGTYEYSELKVQLWKHVLPGQLGSPKLTTLT
ncbi:unnamed protein product [Citrullus colocynthis]|uniref:Uncharacterized protein n=1 Tax=Citrullus colocynthis TaxID=252529 RepID=A0ABP0YFQ4_9ROSI